jgi:hypothetical protein
MLCCLLNCLREFQASVERLARFVEALGFTCKDEVRSLSRTRAYFILQGLQQHNTSFNHTKLIVVRSQKRNISNNTMPRVFQWCVEFGSLVCRWPIRTDANLRIWSAAGNAQPREIEMPPFSTAICRSIIHFNISIELYGL